VLPFYFLNEYLRNPDKLRSKDKATRLTDSLLPHNELKEDEGDKLDFIHMASPADSHTLQTSV
jgi:hypothetical protein